MSMLTVSTEVSASFCPEALRPLWRRGVLLLGGGLSSSLSSESSQHLAQWPLSPHRLQVSYFAGHFCDEWKRAQLGHFFFFLCLGVLESAPLMASMDVVPSAWASTLPRFWIVSLPWFITSYALPSLIASVSEAPSGFYIKSF